MRIIRTIFIGCLLILTLTFSPAAAQATIPQSNGQSDSPVISADGRFVAFWSLATNLVASDTNNTADVFVRDRQTNQTTLVSVASNGAQGNNWSDSPAISADGRFIAFRSTASNLVSGDDANSDDVFVRDRELGTTILVSLSSAGVKGDSISYAPDISADGRYIVFESMASNLIVDDTNNVRDIFLRDLQTSQTSRVSIASDGSEGVADSFLPALSADGRYVVFLSLATNLVSNDTNDNQDVFIRDLQTGQTSLASVASDGSPADNFSQNPRVSDDGHFVVFDSLATNLTGDTDTNNTFDVFVRDTQANQTSRITNGDDWSGYASLSSDGRYIAFQSSATNLTGGDTNNSYDDFIYDVQTGQTIRVSVASSGAQANTYVNPPDISGDGSLVTYSTQASNLVNRDTNNQVDVFVYALQDGHTSRVSSPNSEPLVPPTVLSPADGSIVESYQPLFQWNRPIGATFFDLRFGLSNPPTEIVYTGEAASYTPPAPLLIRTYYWQVRASDNDGNTSDWSAVSSVNIFSPPNIAPPRNGFTTTTPTLTWTSITGAEHYEIQLDNTPTFSTPLEFTASIPAAQNWVVTSTLEAGTYYWRVRSCPLTGACGAWSAAEPIFIDV